VILQCFANAKRIVIPPTIEVIGPEAFNNCTALTTLIFGSGSRVREIGSKAFFRCFRLTTFIAPDSLEILGDGCFDYCRELKAIDFGESSQLKVIGGGTFLRCKLTSITIPASTEEIDGSAFVDCPLITIRVASGSQNFIVDGNLLLTSDGCKVVRCFGQVREVIVRATVEMLGKSCFEKCKHLERVVFENGSKLRRIGPCALSGCEFLASIAIPALVDIIEDEAFKDCPELEYCLLDENGSLVRIGKEAFAKCSSLRFIEVPKSIESIGQNCFAEADVLCGLKFGSANSLRRVFGETSLNNALDNIGLSEISSDFTIEVSHGGIDSEPDLEFPGWSSVFDADSSLTIFQAI
jgi:hypothetical protein